MMLTHLNRKMVVMDEPRCAHPYEQRQPTVAYLLVNQDGFPSPDLVSGFYCAACGTYVAYDGIYVEQAPVTFPGDSAA